MESWWGLAELWSCSCRCAGGAGGGGGVLRSESGCFEDESSALPIRFVEDLEELTNVDVLLEKVEANHAGPRLREASQSARNEFQRSVLVVGDGNETSTLCNLMAGKDFFDSQDGGSLAVRPWESTDGALKILELDLAKLEELEESLLSQALSHLQVAGALADVALHAPSGLHVLLYVVPFGPVPEEKLRRLIFLTQYLLGNDVLLHLYVVVTDVPSSLHASYDWISSFADVDFGFRHLYALAGKNPSRFVPLKKAQSDGDSASQDAWRKAVLLTCRKHPVHMMPAFYTKLMRKVLLETQVERSKLDQLQSKVAKLRKDLERSSDGAKDSPRILNQASPLHMMPGDDYNLKVMGHDPGRHLCRRLEKAEQDVIAFQAILEKKLQEVRATPSFFQEVADLAGAALQRFWLDLEDSLSSKGTFANERTFQASFTPKKGVGREAPQGLQVFLSSSLSLAMTNSEERPPTLIFDWDDTLCPTTWIRQFPVLDTVKLQLHAGRIEQVLRAAKSFGHVDIVTMANRQWLDQTVNLLSPQTNLWDLFSELGIEVHYAQPTLRLSRVLKGPDPKEGIVAKKVAMSAVLDKYYGDSVKARVQVLSFGDQDTEATALQEVLQAACTKSWYRPICKVVRLPGEPNVEDLGQNLQKILTNLPKLLSTDADLDLDVVSLAA